MAKREVYKGEKGGEEDAKRQAGNSIFLPHSLPLKKVIGILGADTEGGLSKEEAEARLARYGPNELPKIRGPFWRVYLAPIFNGLITIYLVSATALLLLGEQAHSLIWFVIIGFNALLAIVQQYRAQKKLEALQALAADTAVVIRGGEKREIDTTLIVPGDLLTLAQGDRIPADGRLIQASHLTVDESSLTGESAAVEKSATKDPLPPDTPLHARTNMIYRGTYVATGSGLCVVTATGQQTEIGKISRGLETLNTGEIPLRRKVNRLALYLGAAALTLLAISLLQRTILLFQMDQFTIEALRLEGIDAIVNAMTVMPINIPLLTTIVLLTGVLAMARRGVIIRNLSAVESLGRISILCTDKTGTLTRSEMVVTRVWDGENLYQVTGSGYKPSGEIYLLTGWEKSLTGPGDDPPKTSRRPIRVERRERLALLLIAGGLNNDAELVAEEGEKGEVRWRAIGDPTEAALLTLLRKSGINEEKLREQYKAVRDYPFDPRLKRMTRIFTNPQGGYIAFVKGATEVLLPLCTHMGGSSSPSRLTKKTAQEISQLTEIFAAQGYRVLSLAFRRLHRLPSEGQGSRSRVEKGLTYLGFVCIFDPPREGVEEAVHACDEAGIRTVMITGDSLATASTIGRQLGILKEGDRAAEGKEASSLPQEEFQRTTVFARVDPDDKMVIVQRYKEADRAVAVTGDGVNDALALSMSDVGVAMGITGTDVAKEASDMVVSDDSFTSIVEGIRQGRGLFNKIRMMIFFYICINAAEAAIFFGTFLLQPGIPFLTNLQHIFLTISSHSWPGLALVFDRTPKDVMKEKPRNTEAIITRRLAAYMAINAIAIMTGAALAYYLTWAAILPGNQLLVPYGEEALHKARIMSLTVLLFAESLMVLSIRRINQPLHRSLRRDGFWLVYAFIGLVFLMHWGVMYVPQVSEILAPLGINFEYVALTPIDWLVAFTLALPAILGMELVKWACRRRGITF